MGRLLLLILPLLWAGAGPVPAAEVDEVTMGGAEQSRPSYGNWLIPRAVITSDIVDREPVDRLDRIPDSLERVYYFTELRGLRGRTIAHRWSYQERLMAEVQHYVESNRWRAWSSKRLLPQWTGEWSVAVVDEEGDVLREDRFTVIEGE